ncbi:MAG: addiction module protein [Bacteroidota bacterium]
MSKEYQHILARAMSLPQNEFFALVQALLEKVQDKIGQETGISPMPLEDQELFAELDRRVEEIRTGKVKPIP